MPTIIKNITTHIYRSLSLVLIVSIMALTACSGDGGTSPPAGDPSAISAVETAKRAASDVRDSYGIFTLKTGGNTFSNYHLAVKEKSATAPTAQEMKNGALKRNISPTAIHVLIAQRLNAPMVSFAKTFFADNINKTLGTNMSGTFIGSTGLIRDTTATGANAWVKESLLKPSTQYTLYGMENGGTNAEALVTFSTDSAFAHASKATAVQPVLVDSTLAQGHITLSIRADEYYIFPMQSDSTDITIDSLSMQSSAALDKGKTLDILTANQALAGGFDPVLNDLLVLLSKRYNDKRDYYTGVYLLIRPKSVQDAASANSWYYQHKASVAGAFSAFLNFSTLAIQ